MVTQHPEDDYGPDPIFTSGQVEAICSLLLDEESFDAYIVAASRAAGVDAYAANEIVTDFLRDRGLEDPWTDSQLETLRVMGVRFRRYAGVQPGFFRALLEAIRDNANEFGTYGGDIHW